MTVQTIEISTDKSRLDIAKIHNYIAHQSYWGKHRTLKQMQQAIDNSICFGLYDGAEQLGFARVFTDQVSIAYLLDVFIFDQYQGQGLGKQLLENVLNHPQLQAVNWLLRTSDAHELYRRYGFDNLKQIETYMGKPATDRT